MMANDKDRDYGSTVHYRCNEGYVLTGPTERICQDNSQWSESSPICRAILCAEPPESVNAKVTGNIFEFNHTIFIECNVGYEMSGNSQLTCMADGQWSADFPICNIVICPEPENIDNAIWEIYYKESKSASHIEYMSKKSQKFRKSSKVSKLIMLFENEFEKILYRYGQMIKYKCNEGYFKTTDAILECTENGWSSPYPQCHPITCPLPIQIRNGKVIGDEVSFGAVLTYECNEGFEIFGVTMRTCHANKRWTDVEPYCRPKECPRPAQIHNGKTMYDSIKYLSIIRYSCHTGFRLEGNSTRICQSDEHWFGERPACIEIFCEEPSEIPYTIQEIDDLKVGGQIRFSCMEGYKLKGKSVLNCLSDGSWHNAIPSCIQIHCGKPPVGHNLLISGISYAYGAKIHYSCNRGYHLNGKPWNFCPQSGIWSNEAPECELVTCDLPITPDHALLEGGLENYPYIIEHPRDTTVLEPEPVTLSCRAKGYKPLKVTWYKDNRKVRHSTYESKSHRVLLPTGSLFLLNTDKNNDEGLYWCQVDNEFGYASSDNATLTIIAQKNLVIGEEIDTELFDPIQNKKNVKKGKAAEKNIHPAKYSLTESRVYRVDDKIQYQCKNGFEHVGDTTLHCTQDGTWSTDPPMCRRKSCNAPVAPEHAEYRGGNYFYEDIVEFTCKLGYHILGNPIIICNENGNWNTNRRPICVPVSCGQPTFDGEVSYQVPYHGLKHNFGSKATLSCNEGYQLTGSSYLICKASGIWIGLEGPPVCVEMVCDEPPNLTHASVLQDESGHHQIATYSCNKGYQTTAEDRSINCRFGQWTSTNMTCDPVNCYEPIIPANGKITAKHFTLGSIANFSCIHGYEINGIPSIECGADGLWLGEIPDCKPISCSEPKDLINGGVRYSSVLYNSVASYFCQEGYELKGDMNRLCSSDGEWSGHLPQCHRITCGELRPPYKGYMIGVGEHYEDTIKFTCEKGYVLKGIDSVVCQSNGEWSDSNQKCEKVHCSPPASIRNGEPPIKVGKKSYVYGDRIFYSCKEGHLPRGNLASSCSKDGTWSNVKGKCSLVSCGRPKLQKDGSVINGRSFYYTDQVRIQCPPGSKPAGPSTVTCLGDGSWSGGMFCARGCIRECLNGGICIRDNVCSCPSGYIGKRCEQALCPSLCLNGGICTGPHRCTCLSGFTGTRCQTPVCKNDCGIDGKCIEPNICLCHKTGETGETCPEFTDYYYDYDLENQGATHYSDWDIAYLREMRKKHYHHGRSLFK